METYAALLNLKVLIPSSKTNYVAVDRDYWQNSFSRSIDQIDFDERWYLRRYPDVAEAIGRSMLESARQHYTQSGYFEHRLPYDIRVDSTWYLEQYSDVADAVRKNLFQSAQQHFEEIGYREGRHPFPGFKLRHKGES